MIKAYVVHEDPERVDAVVGFKLVRVKAYGHPDARGASFEVFSLEESKPSSRPEKAGIIKWDGFCEMTSEPSFAFDAQEQLQAQVNALVVAFRLSFRWRDNDQAYGHWDEVEEIDFRDRWNEQNWHDGDPEMGGLGNYQQDRLHYPESAAAK